MDIQGISAGAVMAQVAQKANETPEAQVKPAQPADQPFLSKLERLGADHPLTKFLGGFYAQHVDTQA
ncbi:MAG: hypothetical protein ACOZB3_05620 [Calditrichota bacterium]